MPRDPRTYITVHDGLPEHPKVEGLSDAAFRLLLTSWCYCSRNLTDGKIKADAWGRRGTARARSELVAAGLVEMTDTGVLMHDYTEHQRTAGEVEELRSKRADAGRRGGLAKASNRVASATANGKQVPSTLPSKPLAVSETDENKSKRVREVSRFPEFWAAYPLKRGKAAAERNWDSLMRRGVDPQPIIDGAKAYAKEVVGVEQSKIKYPQGWLTDGRYEDELEPSLPTQNGFYSAPTAPADMPRHLFVKWNKAHFAAHQQGKPGPSDWHELELEEAS
jgi:hypothetical protein